MLTCILGLLLVCHADNPMAFKSILKGNFLSSRRLTRRRGDISYFRKLVHQLISNNLFFKELLVLDTASGHPAHLDDFHQYVKVVYISANTTALLQPRCHCLFNPYYIQGSFTMASRATEKDNNLTLKDF